MVWEAMVRDQKCAVVSLIAVDTPHVVALLALARSFTILAAESKNENQPREKTQ
jgi:hypothetical protein